MSTAAAATAATAAASESASESTAAAAEQPSRTPRFQIGDHVAMFGLVRTIEHATVTALHGWAADVESYLYSVVDAAAPELGTLAHEFELTARRVEQTVEQTIAAAKSTSKSGSADKSTAQSTAQSTPEQPQ